MPPQYEHLCEKGHEFEKDQKINDKPVKWCPVCGTPAKRLISKSNFVLKGKGWESDGYSGGKDSK